MKALVGSLITIAAIAGCGVGPKHLSRFEYQHGKAAFEMLERCEREFSADFQNSASAEMETIGVHNLDLVASLSNYDTAILLRAGAQSRLSSVELKAIQSEPMSPDMARHLASEQSAANESIEAVGPIIKLCHDEAAAYFDANAASTGECEAKITSFKNKYPH